MAEVPGRIKELVDIFEQHIDTYQSQQYNETQLRREFIDPLFKELGWDVANTAGYAQAYKDVIHEDAIKIGGATKAPDYCFRIGGVRKFFLEAKKPSINIKGDPHPAYQLRRYAWSAKLPLSILTDFEEFAVYDCQIRPKQTDKADVARIMYFTYKDYLDNWEKIFEIFGRESILKGSFDKFAASTKGKRGTTTVDIEFLKEIEKWREMLAKIIAIRNQKLSTGEINFAVQRTIDRILFLRMCEDRGIEDYGQLLKISSGNRAYPRLCEIFEKADQKYNSGLFHFQDEKDRHEAPDTLTPNIKIDDKDLKWILYNLYFPQCPYEFSVLPAEILGNVYEQFLGKVIRLTTAHQARVEDKPEVKKAGGVYYTPSYIVDYIVTNTIGKLCEGKTPRQIANIKILDPACGSGSFLLGAFSFLLDYIRDWYVNNDPKKHAKKIYQGKADQWFLTIAEKKKILLNSIYGVDIDSQAVEVTKLSLLLKVLEGENAQSLENQYRLFHERALPDLADNIKCGNSLIGPDFYDSVDSASITDELREKINPFDWHAEFPKIFSGKNPGFDVVIGNPPYVRIQILKETQHESLEFFSKTYQSASKGNYDIYVVFVEKAIQLLNNNGLQGYILPHKFFNAKYGYPLRELIANGNHLSHIVHFGDQQVFYGATTYTCLLFLQKSPSKEFKMTPVKDLNDWIISKKASSGILLTKDVTPSEWNFVVGSSLSLIKKMQSMPIKLGDIAHLFVGLQTSADSVFILEVKEETKESIVAYSQSLQHEVELEYDICKLLLKGSSIHRYCWQEKKLVLIFPYNTKSGRAIPINEIELRRNYPKTFKYLKLNKKRLLERANSKENFWFLYTYPKNLSEFCLPKLMTGVLALRASFTYDFNGTSYFVGGGNAGGYGIRLKPENKIQHLYLLGLLNSSLLDYILKRFSTRFRGGYYSYARRFIELLPIRTIDFDSPDEKAMHDKMVKLVENMLDLHKKLDDAKIPSDKTKVQRQIDATDKQIDKLVYKLYDLTEDEIKIVEEG